MESSCSVKAIRQSVPGFATSPLLENDVVSGGQRLLLFQLFQKSLDLLITL
jgi:hypothetical protein